ncbi:MAG: LPXTG cell wall anchor domain-containing protein, partial [Mogibacterium sp.]|nr:LPXTG cell wall anchor domain-containing protein [Mogibacterium sp.]
LKGAGFTLSKKQADGTYAAVGEEVKGTDLTTFVWKGLDDGEYKLEETTVPDGYTKAQDITFKVVATHEPDSADPKLSTLEVQDVTPATATFTVDKNAGDTDAHGNIYTGIANKSGATLPETGGIGTIIFYVLGSLLVVGCGIVLISKRRMESR